jgi:hypothetical protein
MKCPHCNVSVHDAWTGNGFGSDDPFRNWTLSWFKCPNTACGKFIIKLTADHPNGARAIDRVVHPVGYVRPVPPEVTDPFASEFTQAVSVLALSPMASAALSRRVLQNVLKQKGQATGRDLIEQIDSVLPRLPGHLQDLHAIRNIGNFAAHPTKNTNTGEIVDVEPGESEWLLDILERVFDYYFVQPAIRRKQTIALNEKLKAAGKPELPLP